MRMQEEPLYFATSSNEMTIVSSKMAPIQVVHNIYVIALKSPGATLLCYCSVHVDASSINKDSMTSSYIHPGPALRIGKLGSCLGPPSKRGPQDSITAKQYLIGIELSM